MKNLVLCLGTILLLCVANVFAQKVSQQTQKQIVKQMISNGDIDNACVKKEGGALKVVGIELLNLNRDKQPEYLITGYGCASSGRWGNQWIYQHSESSYRKIFEAVNVSVVASKTRTNGYLDLVADSPLGGWGVYRAIFKFDGSNYRFLTCQECDITSGKEKCVATNCDAWRNQ